MTTHRIKKLTEQFEICMLVAIFITSVIAITPSI